MKGWEGCLARGGGGGVQGLGGQIYVGWEALGAMATDIWNLKASL